MRIIRFILKAMVLPVLPLLIMLQWIGIFLNSISGVIFGILSGIIAFITIASFMFGQSTGSEAIRMLAAAFILFVLPYVGDWIIERIIGLRVILGEFIRS